jgi:phosphoribosylanthranilate isomerase
MSVAVKICGITDAAALEAASEAGADWIGLVFFPPSPRFLTADAAASLLAGRSHPASVGLFVDPVPEEIARVLDREPLSALQVYGASVDAALLRARFGLPVWRAFGVSARADLPAGAGGAARLVLEAKPPAEATRPGGNARQFDWSLLAGWQPPGPWMLAGGLDAANVAEAIRRTGAGAVDVSSGVEHAPGRKDPALIRAFVAAARAA